jgi:hypothetical protein
MKYIIENASSVIELKDGRKLLGFNNNFVKCVMSSKGIIEKVSDKYYNDQKKHRAKKQNS